MPSHRPLVSCHLDRGPDRTWPAPAIGNKAKLLWSKVVGTGMRTPCRSLRERFRGVGLYGA